MIIGYAVSMCKLLYKDAACDKLPSINACRCAQTYKSVYTGLVVGMVLITEPERVMDIQEIHYEAKCAAAEAARVQAAKWGDQWGMCGFAWIKIYGHEGKKIRANSKLGKALAEVGIKKGYDGVLYLWDPAGLNTQNMDIKEAGAEAYAEVFKKYGFDAYPDSRLD